MFRRLIGTFVREPQLRVLESALADIFRLSNATGWLHLHALVRRQPVRCLIVDPFHRESGDEQLSRIFDAYPELPLIIYFSPNPASFQKLLRLPRKGKIEYLIQGFEDSPSGIVRMVRDMLRIEFKVRLKRSLRRRFGRLTPPLQETLNALIDTPERFLRSSEIAAESGVTTASLYRDLSKSSLRSPKRLIIASRAMDAFLALKNPGIMVGDVSEQLGYAHPRIFSKHFHLVFGISPSESRRTVAPATAVERVVAFIQV